MKKVTEQVLWQLYQGVKQHLSAFKCVPHSLKYLSEGKGLVYLMDFADVFPVMYPDRGKRSQPDGIRLVEEFSGGFPWKNLFKQAKNEGITLALAPASRLEVFEMLRRPMMQIDSAVTKILPENILDQGTDEILSYINKVLKDSSSLISKLEPFVSDNRIEESIRAPAKRLKDLYDSKILRNIEEVLPKRLLAQAIELGRQDEDQTYLRLKKSFDGMPRRNADSASYDDLRRHRFHDAVDIHNLRLAHELVRCGKSEGIYAPLVSSARRTVAAGVRLDRAASFVQPSLSLTLMLIILAQYGRSHVDYHAKATLQTLEQLNSQLSSFTLLHDIEGKTPAEREAYFSSDEKEVVLTRHVEKLLDSYLDEISSLGQDDQDAGCDLEKRKGLEQEGKITDIKGLVSQLRGEKELRKDVVGKMKALIGNFEDEFSDAFLPDCDFVDNLTSWVRNPA